MTRFHSDDYVNFIKKISPENMHEFVKQLQRCNICFYHNLERICPTFYIS